MTISIPRAVGKPANPRACRGPRLALRLGHHTEARRADASPRRPVLRIALVLKLHALPELGRSLLGAKALASACHSFFVSGAACQGCRHQDHRYSHVSPPALAKHTLIAGAHLLKIATRQPSASARAVIRADVSSPNWRPGRFSAGASFLAGFIAVIPNC